MENASFKWGLIAAIAVLIVFSLLVDPRPSKYDKAIQLSGEWFLRNQDDSFLHYEYLPGERVYSDKTHRLREMGALWSISSLAACRGDAKVQELADRGIRFFERYIVHDWQDDFSYVNITPRSLKLGYSAFMILSLLEVDYPSGDVYIEDLAKGILHQQHEDGSFGTFFLSNRTSGQDYYPGEALLSLMALYEHTEDERYLRAVETAFPYYSEYWRQNPTTAFVPWQTRAYTKYYQQIKRDEVSSFIFEMNDFILAQYESDGCSNFQFSGIVLPVYVEGVAEAYKVARIVGDAERADCYGNFVQEGVSHTLSLQVTDENLWGNRGVGGFRSGKGSMRVDRTQHALLALMEACQAGLVACRPCTG